jgi:hypothetical protein
MVSGSSACAARTVTFTVTIGQYCIYDNAYVDVKAGVNCPDCGRPMTITEENSLFRSRHFKSRCSFLQRIPISSSPNPPQRNHQLC